MEEKKMKMIRYANPMFNDFYNTGHWFDEALGGIGLIRRPSDVASAARRGYRPLAEAYEDEGNYNLRFELPGVRKGDVTVELNDSVVTVKGERKEERDGAESAMARGERDLLVVSFSRSVVVPKGINSEKAKARLKDGLLVVSFPKDEGSRQRLISVN